MDSADDESATVQELNNDVYFENVWYTVPISKSFCKFKWYL